ncbi:cellulose synthase/poly-beta-1,6-N-acetylglucosamine synthase-like glycosyltransferase [Neolewinella xylanilytica]|uniref:Cellulose synthase/poly-beta-1,6-N-acetylglucosamine synthase-like glycosyltransferase n=1 Tax=Neolewinella xylanilytica TaxID=1514080 RepID=A0A2S6I1D6_9BACT|nr:glycosyltransferase [Neolewinella xylanilytica]PPK84766.1 cellulose synthase/poly-beta-1,6-N-acetylglucosamine synthase-like glycosyltransferase [Neolewinella xylanilytica]
MLTLLLVALTVQVAAWLFIFYRALDPAPGPASHEQPVSVLVCFHNEAATLEACLRSILTQRHSAFELLAVDDNSTDGSGDIAAKLAGEDDRLRIIDPGDTNPGKRDALRAGLRAANHDIVLLTDADCIAASDEWLTRMTAPLAQSDEVVLGCAPLRGGRSLLAAWQRYEATHVALHYQGLARRGYPYMAVGRNLAYQRTFFRRAGGFPGPDNLPGGDDDLIVGYYSRARTTARVTEPAAWTFSTPVPTLVGYIKQKLRHQSVGLHYRGAHQALLVGLALSHGLFYLTGFFLLFTAVWKWALLAYALRALVVAATFWRKPVRQFLGGDAGVLFFLKLPMILVFDLLYSWHYVFLLTASFSSSKSW